jgi:septum site-determining protein MinC
MARESSIVLKGVGYGIRLFISEKSTDVRIIKDIRELPAQSFSLATGNCIIIDLQSRQCSGLLISKLIMELVWNRNLNILSWSSSHSGTLNKLKAAKLPTGEYRFTHEEKPEEKTEEKNEENTEEKTEEKAEEITGLENELYVLPTLLIHRSLRSGEKIEHDGDVTVFGHVNNGAEIIASGNILVFGKLKGLAHAGVNIREGSEAYIFAYSFEPQQIRLGNLMNSKVGSQMPWWGKPVFIFAEESSLIIKGL